MSQKITCRCKTENLNENVIQKALADLCAMFSRARFSVSNRMITANFDQDCYSRNQVNQAIQEKLSFYQKQYLQEQKIKWLKVMKVLGMGKVDEIATGKNVDGQTLTKIKVSR